MHSPIFAFGPPVNYNGDSGTLAVALWVGGLIAAIIVMLYFKRR